MRCDPMASGRVGTSDLREAYEIEGGLDAHVYLGDGRMNGATDGGCGEGG